MTNAAKTLIVPFDTGAMPAPSGDWAFLNAVAHAPVRDLFADAGLICEQPDRPAFVDLQRAGHDVVASLPGAPGSRFDGALVLVGKHKRLNQHTVARASGLTRPGAPVLVAGDKTLGIASLRKWAAGHVAITGGWSKHHAQVFHFAADPDAFADAAPLATEPMPGFVAAPGMFSPDRVDDGSALLAEHIDGRVAGAVADFGAGWGYLAARIAQQGAPRSLDVIEAYRPALDAALANIAPLAGDLPVAGRWLDITSEPLPRRYDWIVMNPPFHTGRASAPELGLRFIAVAAGALEPGGRLLMVANRQLPYEKMLAGLFAQTNLLAGEAGFKVIEAARPKR